LEKDLFVPFIEQKERMQAGKKYLVYLYKDEMTDRLTASSRVMSYVEKEDIELSQNQEVSLLIARESELGFSVIINHKYSGLLYHNEVHRALVIGDTVTGYVKTVREDNKIDVTLQKQGYSHVEPNAHAILSLLRKSDGFLNLHDKSDPDEISIRLKMSKKTFKKAIGLLYREKMIRIESDGIYMI
jgi:predicted RNA-binding protein (virulence factor B family)